MKINVMDILGPNKILCKMGYMQKKLEDIYAPYPFVIIENNEKINFIKRRESFLTR